MYISRGATKKPSGRSESGSPLSLFHSCFETPHTMAIQEASGNKRGTSAPNSKHESLRGVGGIVENVGTVTDGGLGEAGLARGLDAGGAPGIQICEGVVRRGEVLW